MIHQVRYNWFYCIHFGESFCEYTVGRDYDEGDKNLTVECIVRAEDDLRGFVVVKFTDGSYKLQGNINSTLYINET